MGMESYSIMIVPKEVSLVCEEGYQKIIGRSEIDIVDVEEKLKSKVGQFVMNGRFIYDECLELFLYQQEGKLQALELKGCLSWLKEGVKNSFQLISYLQDEYGELDTYVLNKKIEYEKESELHQEICIAYNDKIAIFEKQYGNIELKATCGNFYKEVVKHTKWYYKILKGFKGKG